MKNRVGLLEHLDLTACENVTEATLYGLTGRSTRSQNDRENWTIKANVESLVPVQDAVISLSLIDSSQNLMIEKDPSFTDLSVLTAELCALGCFDGDVCRQGSEELNVGEPSVTGRGCCQTKNTFPGKTDKNIATKSTPKTGCCSGGGGCGGVDVDIERQSQTSWDTTPSHPLQQLRFLSLNGCFRIHDDGLR